MPRSATVARNTDGPLGEEFFHALRDMQLGSGRMDALQSVSDRVDVEDLRVFVNAMVQADRLGVPVANVLRTQSAEMRIKRTQRAEEAAQKLGVKMTFPLIFFIMPSLMIVVIGPAVIRIINDYIAQV